MGRCPLLRSLCLSRLSPPAYSLYRTAVWRFLGFLRRSRRSGGFLCLGVISSGRCLCGSLWSCFFQTRLLRSWFWRSIIRLNREQGCVFLGFALALLEVGHLLSAAGKFRLSLRRFWHCALLWEILSCLLFCCQGWIGCLHPFQLLLRRFLTLTIIRGVPWI